VLLKSRLGGMALKRSDPPKELPMGKIADALERHKKEKSTKLEFLQDTKPVKPMRSVSEEREIAYAREFCTLHECNPKVIVLSDPDSEVAGNFKLLRGQIIFAKNRTKPRLIMVTSTFPGEGKSFVAANLAASLALSVDEYVFLIDCDLRRPSVHYLFGYPNPCGLHEHLIGQKKLKEIIVETSIDKLSIVPTGRISPNPTELISSAAMRTFLKELKDRYEDRFIVIDAPPSLVTAEANSLAGYVDGIIFVVRANRSPRRDIQKAIRNLGSDKILGIVFNGYYQGRERYQKYYEKYYRGQ
jgi:exopolysaccharide/PEP-CTERM locus tyrosine autokinase